jgi:chemotaxis protein methyltransferase CheR
MMTAARHRSYDESVDLTGFKELLLSSCGHSFEHEREQALFAGVSRRMETLGLGEGYDAYLALLFRDTDELLRLTELLTVNETYFYREPDHLNFMVETLIPAFISLRKGKPVKIVSAGCSTGEEPYSIAIMLRERFGAECERLFAITGVDIDSTAIGVARQGVYGSTSFRGMDQALIERHFAPQEAGKFRVTEAVRKQVQFDVVNLLGAVYPVSMQEPDIILYRNVSIYFPGQVQRDIFGRLAGLLVDGGCLLVGASETIHHDIGILSLVKQNSLFFYRKTPPLIFEERRTASRHGSAPERAQVGTAAKKAVVPRAASVPQAAVEHPRKHLHAAPLPDIKARFDEAVALAHGNEHDKALALLDVIIGQDSTFEKASVLKGSLLLSLARFDEARAVCEGILARDPLCLEACLMLGMIARQHGDDDDAFKRFREALYLSPGCWLAHFYSGEILYAQQAWKRARGSFESALKVLESGSLKAHGQTFFPLTFNAEQFIIICRHKLSLLASSK